MNKRIVLVGPTASGKNILRDRLAKRGYTFDVSYTTRELRKEVDEQEGIEYHFISDDKFEEIKAIDGFYEKVEYNGYKYGTGRKEWESKDVFIMEPTGVDCILDEDRKSCFIIYLNPPIRERIIRMRINRKWSIDQIDKRLKSDSAKFLSFYKYDIQITNPNF